MPVIHELIGNEVYILTYLCELGEDGGLDLLFGETDIFSTQIELMEYLNAIPASEYDPNSIVIHGVPILANTLPEVLPETADTYIFILNETFGSAILIPYNKGIDLIADLISLIVKSNHGISIEDVFLIFGENLEQIISIQELDIDDPLLEEAYAFSERLT